MDDINQQLLDAAKTGDLKSLTEALQAGADINFRMKNESLARLAISHGHADCLGALIQAGCDIEAKGSRGETAAMLAAASGDRKCLALLIEAGCDVNARDDFGMTAAMWMARLGQPNMDHACLDLLIQAGADVKLADRGRRTAATHAKVGGKPAMAAHIKAHLAAIDEKRKLTKSLGKVKSAAESKPTGRSIRM